LNTLKMIAAKGRGLSYSETTLDGLVVLNVRTSSFSDLVIRATFLYQVTLAKLAEQLYFESTMLAAMQCELTAKYGVLLRGGISFGDLYMDQEVVFGPALVDAYLLAEKVAKFPRIVVDPRIMKVIKESARNYDELNELWSIRIDDGGVFAIDYLQAAYSADSESLSRSYGFKSFDQMMANHSRTITSQLERIHEDDDKVRQKIIWLARYHNIVVTDLKEEGCFVEGHERLLIPEESFGIKQEQQN